MKHPSFLDDDFVPADPEAFEAGRQREIARRNSPEEIARVKQWGEEMGRKVAEGLKTILNPKP